MVMKANGRLELATEVFGACENASYRCRLRTLLVLVMHFYGNEKSTGTFRKRKYCEDGQNVGEKKPGI